MFRRKDGLFQEILIINGRRKYFYGKTKQIVLQKIQEFRQTEEHGEMFRKVADEWWNVHEPTLAYNSQKNYMPALKRAIEAFGDVPIKSIEPTMIAREISAFSHGRADKTVRTQLMIYNLIFRYAVEKGFVLYNPARDLSVPRNLKKNRRTSPSPEDIRRVKESTELPFGMFAYFAMYTGLRRGELLALEWSDVDLKSRTISVNKSLYYEGNKPVIKLPKTQTSIAEVPIMDVLMKKLPKEKKKGIIFSDEDGNYLTETRFQALWKKYCLQAGISASPHQFRHAYATMLFEAGIPPEEAQALLRHAQLSTTMDIYTDLREAKLKRIHEKVYSVDIE